MFESIRDNTFTLQPAMRGTFLRGIEVMLHRRAPRQNTTGEALACLQELENAIRVGQVKVAAHLMEYLRMIIMRRAAGGQTEHRTGKATANNT